MNRPTIPREVADAIERLSRGGTEKLTLVHLAVNGGMGPSAQALCTYVNEGNFDTLLAALVNGYEVERTAEEERQAAHEAIRTRYVEVYRNKFNVDTEYGFARGIKFALNELGIKISGVNAPEEVNA